MDGWEGGWMGGREPGWAWRASSDSSCCHNFMRKVQKTTSTVLWLFFQTPIFCSLPVLQSSCKARAVQPHGRNQL